MYINIYKYTYSHDLRRRLEVCVQANSASHPTRPCHLLPQCAQLQRARSRSQNATVAPATVAPSLGWNVTLPREEVKTHQMLVLKGILLPILRRGTNLSYPSPCVAGVLLCVAVCCIELRCVHTHTHTHARTHTHTRTHICMHTHMHAHAYIKFPICTHSRCGMLHV